MHPGVAFLGDLASANGNSEESWDFCGLLDWATVSSSFHFSLSYTIFRIPSMIWHAEILTHADHSSLLSAVSPIPSEAFRRRTRHICLRKSHFGRTSFLPSSLSYVATVCSICLFLNLSSNIQGTTLTEVQSSRLAEITTIILCTCFPMMPRFVKLIKNRRGPRYGSENYLGYSGDSSKRSRRSQKIEPCGDCASCVRDMLCESPRTRKGPAVSSVERTISEEDQQRLYPAGTEVGGIELVETDPRHGV